MLFPSGCCSGSDSRAVGSECEDDDEFTSAIVMVVVVVAAARSICAQMVFVRFGTSSGGVQASQPSGTLRGEQEERRRDGGARVRARKVRLNRQATPVSRRQSSSRHHGLDGERTPTDFVTTTAAAATDDDDDGCGGCSDDGAGAADGRSTRPRGRGKRDGTGRNGTGRDGMAAGGWRSLDALSVLRPGTSPLEPRLYLCMHHKWMYAAVPCCCSCSCSRSCSALRSSSPIVFSTISPRHLSSYFWAVLGACLRYKT